MVKCPKCGTNMTPPVKTWRTPSRKPWREGEKPKIAKIFECLSCKAKFGVALETEVETEEKASIKNMVERIRGIRGELVQTLKSLHEKIRTLEIERANLIMEISKLRKVAESRASTLESEVNMLRDELKSLRDLLGYVDEPEK